MFWKIYYELNGTRDKMFYYDTLTRKRLFEKIKTMKEVGYTILRFSKVKFLK